MSSPDFISNTINKILSDLQNDDLFIQVLGASEEEVEDGLVYTRLFPFTYIYNGTQTEVKTYVCVDVSIKSVSRRNEIYSYPTIIFDIISHQDDVRLNMAGISKTRLNYLADIIKNKYNGSTDFGYGKLTLVSNEPYNVDTTYRERRLIFSTIDMNVSLCG